MTAPVNNHPVAAAISMLCAMSLLVANMLMLGVTGLIVSGLSDG